MVRSAAVGLALLILPGLVHAQVLDVGAPLQHVVVEGDNLWDLSQHYYQTPWDWRRIYEANIEVIEDPNLIYPGEILTIPDRMAEPSQEPAAEEPAAEEEEEEEGEMIEIVVGDEPTDTTGFIEAVPLLGDSAARLPTDEDLMAGATTGADMRQERTIFFRDPSRRAGGIVNPLDNAYLAVARIVAYAAPWLIRLETLPEHEGTVMGFAQAGGVGRGVRRYDRVFLSLNGPLPAEGTELLVYRVSRTIPEVGEVVMPTGLIEVTTVGPEGVVGTLVEEYDRVAQGDLVGPAPDFDLVKGQYAEPLTTRGPQAMIMGFAEPSFVKSLGDIAFLDLGRDDGIRVGDEFHFINSAIGGEVEGRLQVIKVRAATASARVVYMTDDVFQPGVIVRLALKMR
ncbi:MAG: LysM peptidoglycan-binding domain-containing protein [Gemmatimonadota bacterium]|nr:LysM peptidoglycan-binding domain-containing protein [Gemmatimonadota bacterium]